MARYEVTIPQWHPATVNQLMKSVRDRCRLKRQDRELIAAYVKLQANVPVAAGKRRVGLKLQMAKGQIRADADAYHKSLLDGLKRAGLIVNDSPDWVEIGPVSFDPTRKPGQFATTVILEDMI
jgi:hypothetical protein